MNEKLLVLQNSLENMLMEYMKVAELSHFDVITCLDSVSNTFRKMLLTKIAYDINAEKNTHAEEIKNADNTDNADCDGK